MEQGTWSAQSGISNSMQSHIKIDSRINRRCYKPRNMRLMALPSSALNPFVAGSIPARPTNEKGLAEMRGLLFFYGSTNCQRDLYF